LQKGIYNGKKTPTIQSPFLTASIAVLSKRYGIFTNFGENGSEGRNPVFDTASK